MSFPPRGHHERVVDGDADDVLDAQRPQRGCLCHVAWEVGAATARCERPRDSKQDDAATCQQRCKGHRLSASITDRDGREGIPYTHSRLRHSSGDDTV